MAVKKTNYIPIKPFSIAPTIQPPHIQKSCTQGSMGGLKYDYPPSDWTLIQKYMNDMIHDGKKANNSFFQYQKIPSWPIRNWMDSSILPWPVRDWDDPFVSPWVTGPIPQSHVPHAVCDCDMDFNEVDPVYSGELFMTGIGLGYEASPIFIVELDDMQEFTSEDDCPENAIDYILHINRLTEKPIINRET